MKSMTTNFHRRIHLAGTALLLLLASCSDDGLPASGGGTDAAQAQVPLRVAGASTGTGIGVQTRIAADRTELTSGSIGMFRKADAPNGYTALGNQCFTYATPFWQTGEQIMLGTPNALLAACYPYAEGRVNPVVLNSRRYDTANDFHYVSFRANKRTSAVTLDLSRVYSRILFNFKADAGYFGDGKVTAIRLEGDGIVPTATLDMLDDAVLSPGGSVRDVLKPVTGLDVAEISGLTTQFTAMAAGTADCLMIPHLLQGDITLTVTVDGKKKTGRVTAAQLCGTGGILREGVKYQVNISIRQLEGLVINSIRTTDWDSQPAWDEDVTFEPPVVPVNVPKKDINLGGAACTDGDKDVPSKLTWAGGNLKSNDDSKPYEWAETTTDYGYYYPWNSTYGHDGYTGGNNTDPCSKLDVSKYGANWRLPSYEETDALSRCTDKVLTDGGMWFMNNSKGLFLPAAGYRSNTEGSGTTPTGNPETYGYYWNSGAFGEGCSLYFNSGSARVDYKDGSSGFSVRCVK